MFSSYFVVLCAFDTVFVVLNVCVFTISLVIFGTPVVPCSVKERVYVICCKLQIYILPSDEELIHDTIQSKKRSDRNWSK